MAEDLECVAAAGGANGAVGDGLEVGEGEAEAVEEADGDDRAPRVAGVEEGVAVGLADGAREVTVEDGGLGGGGCGEVSDELLITGGRERRPGSFARPV